MVIDSKKVINGLDCPKQLLFMGSGQTKTPKDWLSLPSIRINSRTFEQCPDNIYGVITWPSSKDGGLGGVIKGKNKGINIPNIFLFNHLEAVGSDVGWFKDTKIYTFPVLERYSFKELKEYVTACNKLEYPPRNSNGLWIVLWLLYANVEEIYISGYDGWMCHSGKERGQWQVENKYYDCNGTLWAPNDYKEIENGNYFFHNLYTEWLAIEAAIKKARERGVVVTVAK